jgi:hypothetical protein
MKTGVGILGVIGNDNDTAAGSDTGASQITKKAEEGGPIEPVLFPTEYEAAIAQSDRTEISHALARGRMQQDRIFDFRRDPHSTTRPVLLKMHFVCGPQVDGAVAHQFLEFFLCDRCNSGFA